MLNSKKMIIVGILVLMMIPIAKAQQANSSDFDQSRYYQGDNGRLTVVLYNDHTSYQITTKQCYLQFDWQTDQKVAFIAPQTPTIASKYTGTFTFDFSIPSNVAVGYHTYKVVWVDNGLLLGSQTVISSSLYVGDAYEKSYNNLINTVSDKRDSYSGFSDPTAQSYLQQANTAYSLASSSAQQGQWYDAVNKLQQASNYYDQARSAQTIADSRPQSSGSSYTSVLGSSDNNSNSQSAQQNFTPLLAIVGVVVVVVAIVFYMRSQKKTVDK